MAVPLALICIKKYSLISKGTGMNENDGEN
jgi:hypothetical protein